MPIVRLKDGTEIECSTAEVRQVVGQLTDLIAVPSGEIPLKKREARNKNPGVGPAKLWAMAQWYSFKVNATKNDARTQLAKLKREALRQFLDLEEEYKAFIAWYAKRGKIDPPEKAGEALSTLYEVDIDQYKALVTEFNKQHKKVGSKTKATAARKK